MAAAVAVIQHKVLTTDELGLLKVTEVPAKEGFSAAKIVNVWGEPERNNAITAVCSSAANLVLEDSEDGTLLAVARRGGAVQLLAAGTGAAAGTLPKPSAPTTSPSQDAADVAAMAYLTQQASSSTSKIITCTKGGVLSVFSSSSTIGEASTSGRSWECAHSSQRMSSILAMGLSSGHTHVALGGEGCNLRVYDLAAAKDSFLAKGNKPNAIGLVDKPYITAITYTGTDAVMAGTADHKLWLYDVRVGRRPQVDLSWGSSRITDVQMDPRGGRTWVSNATGHIEAYDFTAGKMQCAIKGIAGSVRSLQLHPTEPLLASVGLDRFLRVHCTETRKLLGKVHLKQQLTGVRWLPVKSVEQQEEELRRQQQEQQQGQQQQGGDGGAAAGQQQQLRGGEVGGKRKGGRFSKGQSSKKGRQ